MPPILYHYTDADGLMGIAASPNFPKVYVDAGVDFTGAIKFLASDVRFMNDRAELRHAGEIFARRFREVAKNPSTPRDRSELLDQLAKTLEVSGYLGDPVQVFAACFSGESDELSQWRGYAGGTGGYAIGIARRTLDHFTFALPVTQSPLGPINGEPPSLMWPPRRVFYKENEAIREADRLAQTLQPGSPVPGISANFGALWETVAKMARFKDMGFKDEEEWRMIWYHAPNNTRMSMPAEFRTGRFGVLPFLSIAVNPTAGPPWIAAKEEAGIPRPTRTIDDLVVGPSPDQPLRVTAAKQLLETNGHDPSVVRASPIPFRG